MKRLQKAEKKIEELNKKATQDAENYMESVKEMNEEWREMKKIISEERRKVKIVDALNELLLKEERERCQAVIADKEKQLRSLQVQLADLIANHHLKGQCSICYTKPSTVMPEPCKHLCMCQTCYDDVLDARVKSNIELPEGEPPVPTKCPICNREFGLVISGVNII